MFRKFAYPSLAFTLLLTVNFITNTLLPSSTAIFENVLKTRVGHPVVLFLRGLLPIFPHFMGTAWRSVAILANFANVLITHVAI